MSDSTLTLSRSIQQQQTVGGGYFTNSLVEVDISTERPCGGTDWFYVVERTTEDGGYIIITNSLVKVDLSTDRPRDYDRRDHFFARFPF
jgi:hypothetical protein